MTNIFAREPVFDIRKKLFAYQFFFRDSTSGSFPVNMQHLQASESESQGLSIDDLLQTQTTIVNLLPDSLTDFADYFAPDDVIIEISELSSEPSSELLQQLLILKNKGFQLIAQSNQINWSKFLALCNFVKVNINSTSLEEIQTIKGALRNENVKIIATQVHSGEQFERCANYGFDYVQGFFFLDKISKKQKSLPASKIAYMQLMTEISKPQIDIKTLQHIFEKDPTLSFLLIKFINNPLVNKSFKITSIRHALNYLGELMVRRFVAIISLAGLSSDKPSELLNLSLSRAKYCEMLDAELADKADAMSAFLVGLFSLIDIILDKSLDELLNSLDLDDKITNALLEKNGIYYVILSSAQAMESADWHSLIEVSNQLNVTQEQLFDFHRESVRWQNEMTSAVSTMYPEAQASSNY